MCESKYLQIFQDYTKLTKKKCKTYEILNPKKKLLSISRSPFINNRTIRFGLPLTNKDPLCFLDLDNHNSLWDYFFQNFVDMDNKEILDKYYKEKMPEIEVDFANNEQGKMIINVHYNKTLSKERKLPHFSYLMNKKDCLLNRKKS